MRLRPIAHRFPFVFLSARNQIIWRFIDMIINGELVTKMYEEMDGTKQISRLSVDEDKFRNWCHTLNVISGMSYRKRMLGDDELCDFEVPSALQDIVVPRRISRELGDEFRDLRGKSYEQYMNNLDVHGMTGCKTLDSIEFNRASKAIAGSRKAQFNGTPIDTLSKEVVEEACYDRLNDLSSGLDMAMVKMGTRNYVPIDFTISYMEDEFYTQKVKSVFLKWFSDSLDDLKNA